MTTAHQDAGTYLTYHSLIIAPPPPGSPPSKKKPISFAVGGKYRNRAGESRTIMREFTPEWFEFKRGWRFIDDEGICYKGDGRAHPTGEASPEDLVLR